MKCNEVKFGSYNCTYNIMVPYKCKFDWEDNSKLEYKYVQIDKCLLPEMLKLWELGIKTTGCCCGHGNKEMAFIGVKNEYIPKMKELGYKVYKNDCRPLAEDSFIPKTKLTYGDINKGFNW